jgi:putative adenylate-forming enzyme
VLAAAARSLRDFVGLQWHRSRSDGRAIRRYQVAELSGLLHHARTHSDFYRERFAGLGDDNTIATRIVDGQADDDPSIPTIDKASMMANFDTLNTCGLRLDEVMPWAVERELRHEYLGYYADRFVVGLSSGTSGNKGIYVTPRELTERLPAVFLARGGIPLRLLPYRILFLLRVFSQGFADIESPIVSLRYLSTMTPPEEIVATALADRSNILMAPPSLVRLLLPHARRLRGRLRLVVCYAEVLADEDAARFEADLGAPVVQIYQASEGQIASACGRGTLHVNEDLVVLELLDAIGRPVRDAGVIPASMLVTNLVNRVQPLIRYEMNDLVELGPRCPCGSSFRTIRRILGRQDDVLELRTRPQAATAAPGASSPTRAVFPDLVSRWIITTDDAIREFRVTSHSPDDVEVIVDLFPDTPDPMAICAALRARLVRELEAFDVTVADLHVRVAPLPLPADRSKYKRFVNAAAAAVAEMGSVPEASGHGN